MSILHIDFESRSTVELKKTGAYPYAAHETTDLWCACFAFDDGPVEVWRPGDPVPGDIAEHVMLGEPLIAHNAAFERTMWHYILGPRYGWPEPDIAQWSCTMVMCYAMGLPGALEMAAPAAGLDIAKDGAGRRLMLQMAKPRRTKDGALRWWDEPEKIARLIDYCKTDVEVERALHKRLRPLKQSELALWHLDQRINDRGVLVDQELAVAAKAIVARAEENLDKRISQLTNYEVTACSNRNQIVAWMALHGVKVDSISKDKIEELLEDPDLPPPVREILDIRREAAKASVAKIDALLRGASPEDGRAKGLLQFNAASTGRWGGRRFQPQNLRRPEEHDIDTLIEIVATGDYDFVEQFYDEPLSAVADILRGLIVAAPGHRILAADYSNIEGRVLAWLAGEEWKLQAFRDFDAGVGHDLYKITAGSILGKRPEDVTKDERQAYGKVPELALGYQGGVGAFATMGANYGVNLPVWQVEEIRDGWRAAHVRTKAFWYAMENAAIEAVDNPGTWAVVNSKIAFKVTGSFLAMRLPSKRFLFYPYPEIRMIEMPWTDDNGDPVRKRALTYMSELDVSKRGKLIDDPRNTTRWARIKTYGGSLAENATQAAARDVLADAMPRLEAAGYPTILTVHDEIVCEAPDGHGSVGEMERTMCDLPEWAAGLPVAAEGFEGSRYRK